MAYPIVFSILMLSGLMLLWPASNLFGRAVIGSEEVQLLLVVALAGGVGSTVRLLRIIPKDYREFYGKNHKSAQEVTEGSFEQGIPFYLLRPFLGLPVAVILYLALRGGLLSANTSIEQINPFGMAALGGMSGLFADSAVDKLKQVFDIFVGIKPEKREGFELKE